MIRSMTGYGTGRAAEGDVAVVAEVRSVNNRGREIRFRLPGELYAAEEDLRQIVQQAVARGRVDVSLTWEGPPPGGARFGFNAAGAAAMLAAWRQVQVEHGLADEPTVKALLRLPGVIEAAAPHEVERERLVRVAAAALTEALAEHRVSREREGERLAQDLLERHRAINTLVGEINARVAGSAERRAADLRARVQALMGEAALDEARMAQEVALLAQRADVTEEQVRLTAHLERLSALFAPDASEVGRSLEFLLPEIRREVSTLAAKAGDPEIDAHSLAVRVELERIREQAANLE